MSKIKDLRLKKENNVDVVELISHLCPEGKTKYVDTLLRLMKDDFNPTGNAPVFSIVKELTKNLQISKEVIEQFSLNDLIFLVGVIQIFDITTLVTYRRFCDYNEKNRITKNDVSQYKTFKEVEESVSLADEKEREKDLEKQIRKLYEDEEWIVLRPLTYESSKKYGSSTKWCTASETSSSTFNSYTSDGILIYSINRKNKLKVATYKKITSSGGELSFWNEIDNRIDSLQTGLPSNIIAIIMSEITTYPVPNTDFAPKVPEWNPPMPKLESRPILGYDPANLADKKSSLLERLSRSKAKNLMETGHTVTYDSGHTITMTPPEIIDKPYIPSNGLHDMSERLGISVSRMDAPSALANALSDYRMTTPEIINQDNDIIERAKEIMYGKKDPIEPEPEPVPKIARIWNSISNQYEDHTYGVQISFHQTEISEQYAPILDSLLYYDGMTADEIVRTNMTNVMYIEFILAIERIKEHYASFGTVKRSTMDIRGTKEKDSVKEFKNKLDEIGDFVKKIGPNIKSF